MDPQPLPQVEHLQGQNYLFSWEGVPGRVYFIQTSSTLTEGTFDWEFAPDIRVGTGNQIEMGFQASADHFEFFRLVYTDHHWIGDPNLADFDNDGFTNLEEAIGNTDPFDPQENSGTSGNSGNGGGTEVEHPASSPWKYNLLYRSGSYESESEVNSSTQALRYDYSLGEDVLTELVFSDSEGENEVNFLQIEPNLSYNGSDPNVSRYIILGTVRLSAQNPNWHFQAPTGSSSSGFLLPVEFRKRIPDIDDEGGNTTFSYETMPSSPWRVPYPSAEIIEKEVLGDQLTISAEIYDVISDVSESDQDLVPTLRVNSREVDMISGDVSGVFRLEDYNFQLFPGRNEVTVVVENAFGVAGYHTIVVDGDALQGYEIIEDFGKFPKNPTYPVVYEIRGFDFDEFQTITLEVDSKSVDLEREQIRGEVDLSIFRSKPFISLDEPKSSKPQVIAGIPADKPIFLSELGHDIQITMEFPDTVDPAEWVGMQNGIELTSHDPVEILQTNENIVDVGIRARRLGGTPDVRAFLKTFRLGGQTKEFSGKFNNSYKLEYDSLVDEEKDGLVEFNVSNVTLEPGFNNLLFSFEDSSHSNSFSGGYHSFRFEEATELGIRAYSADLRQEVVRDGVVGRPYDSYYSVEPSADLTELSRDLEKSNCQVIGMLDVNGYFDEDPLKRAFLVRGPPGRVFQSFERLYEEQDRETRTQTFNPTGTRGGGLAAEVSRIRNDDDLPDSAKDALNLQIAQSFQLLNGFGDFVPDTSQSYIDPGDGSSQPNSWTLRGTSLPDDLATNPSPWIVTNTLSDPLSVSSISGVIGIDSTDEDVAYYAQTAPSAPWDLNGSRMISVRFQIEEYDLVNGSNGAFQISLGDGIKSWVCQVQQDRIRVNGANFDLPLTEFPDGLLNSSYYTLKIVVPDGLNQASFFTNDNHVAEDIVGFNGGFNGISFGDPGSGIAGRVKFDYLNFDNIELSYGYGIFGSDDYAESEGINEVGNILLYLRSKGQPFRTSMISRWIKLLDPMAHKWLLEKYTGVRDDGVTKELHIFTGTDVWMGDTVDVDTERKYSGSLWWKKLTKLSTVIEIDKENTKFWSLDEERTDIQLAGLLMAWVYQQHEYKVWLAIEEDPVWGLVDAAIMERKHFVESVSKWAGQAYEIISVGGEIAVSVANEGADWAITIKDLSQGEYMSAVGFIPFVPSSAGRVIKVFDGHADEAVDVVHKLSDKVHDFPGGKSRVWFDDLGEWRNLDFDNIFANADDPGALLRARDLVDDAPLQNRVNGWTGKRLLSTFSNSSVTIFKTKEPLKLYRVYDDTRGAKGAFLSFEKPVSKTQVEVDLALGNDNGVFGNYTRWTEVEIPEGEYVYLGYAAKQSDRYRGGGTQVWIEDELIDRLDNQGWWDFWEENSNQLPQF